MIRDDGRMWQGIKFGNEIQECDQNGLVIVKLYIYNGLTLAGEKKGEWSCET